MPSVSTSDAFSVFSGQRPKWNKAWVGEYPESRDPEDVDVDVDANPQGQKARCRSRSAESIPLSDYRYRSPVMERPPGSLNVQTVPSRAVQSVPPHVPACNNAVARVSQLQPAASTPDIQNYVSPARSRRPTVEERLAEARRRRQQATAGPEVPTGVLPAPTTASVAQNAIVDDASVVTLASAPGSTAPPASEHDTALDLREPTAGVCITLV